MRADEHEGSLNSSAQKRAADREAAYATRVLSSDIDELTESEAFIRWFGKYAFPAMMQDFPVNNGSFLAEFMGRRQLILEMIKDMNLRSPGFEIRLLQVREKFRLSLAAEGQKEK